MCDAPTRLRADLAPLGERYARREAPEVGRGQLQLLVGAVEADEDVDERDGRVATYGLAHSVERFSKDAQLAACHTETDVAHLTMVGQDAFAVGIAAAVSSGFITAGYLSKYALLKAVAGFLTA